ncbi:SUKH-4 family immunity protein [Streptomyces sp. NPDC058726]|uniref:SUKH-4 family immunity protein n=1 Tax=Streptomyces sp. NPDC058726 TaxID=3346611 RepID=UPI00367A3C8A
MVTFAQAQERAEEWVNGDVPSYQHREVRVREFDLGFVVWAEDRADGPRSDGGAQRLVIARDSGEATLWPGLPVGEVIRRYEEEYGRDAEAPEPAPAARVDLNQTSFLLSPPEWLQEAADRLGIPDRRGEGSGGAAASAGASGAGPVPGEAAGSASAASSGAGPGSGVGSGPGSSGGAGSGWAAGSAPAAASGPAAASASGAGTGPRDASADSTSAGAGASAPGGADGSGSGSAWPAAGGAGPRPDAGAPAGATPWAGTDTNADTGEDGSVPLPETVFAPQLSESGDDTPPPPPPATAEAHTALMSGGSQLPPTAVGPAIPDPAARQGTPPPAQYGYPQGEAPGAPAPGAPTPPPAGPGTPERPLAAHAGDIADAATSKAAPPRRGGSSTTPPPPGAPGTPGARPGAPAPAPGGAPASGPAGGYVPTQMVPPIGPGGPGVPPPPGGTPPGAAHHAATMFADPGGRGPGAPGTPPPPGTPGPPGAPQPPGPPGVPGAPQPPAAAPGTAGGGRPPVHHAETVLAAPAVSGPGTPPPPAPPGAPGVPGGVPPRVPGAMPPGTPPPGVPGGPGQPPAYGYPPQPTGLPTVGPGYQAVLRYRAQDGSEQQLIRRSAPGTPHPEWQIFHELRSMNVPPDQVLELHTELESCELPGAYCARMIREQWPQARITSIAPYGTDHASRQQGMRQLIAHQGELHQVADGPARPAPVRAPVVPVQPAPPVPPEAVAQELAGAFGPGVFRFEQAAVSRQGVPPVVAHTLVVAGLPMDMGPFFWAQAQPGRPVPTLAELAAERGVQAAADAGSYLVMGSDFGRAVCVQYGTANIVAVPVEAGPGGAPVPPQFVNTGLPEFARCLALLGRMWRLRFGLNQEQAGRWTVDFQAQLAALDPAALGSPESWWSVLLEQMWDGLL